MGVINQLITGGHHPVCIYIIIYILYIHMWSSLASLTCHGPHGPHGPTCRVSECPLGQATVPWPVIQNPLSISCEQSQTIEFENQCVCAAQNLQQQKWIQMDGWRLRKSYLVGPLVPNCRMIGLFQIASLVFCRRHHAAWDRYHMYPNCVLLIYTKFR